MRQETSDILRARPPSRTSKVGRPSAGPSGDRGAYIQIASSKQYQGIAQLAEATR